MSVFGDAGLEGQFELSEAHYGRITAKESPYCLLAGLQTVRLTQGNNLSRVALARYKLTAPGTGGEIILALLLKDK